MLFRRVLRVAPHLASKLLGLQAVKELPYDDHEASFWSADLRHIPAKPRISELPQLTNLSRLRSPAERELAVDLAALCAADAVLVQKRLGALGGGPRWRRCETSPFARQPADKAFLKIKVVEVPPRLEPSDEGVQVKRNAVWW